MRQSYKLIFERSREGRRATFPNWVKSILFATTQTFPAAISALTTGSILSAPAR